ncbi:hypothetical protein KCP69_00315 [Salmonella enterica subsp. enterica]|nr:hypothetical protein KCP69_00315 [Salmonella enterica subsp. enterica]
MAVAIGDGVTATVPLLWVVAICAAFARPTACLWRISAGRETGSESDALPPDEHWLIVPLIMAVIMF